jgi:hypothetical protein
MQSPVEDAFARPFFNAITVVNDRDVVPKIDTPGAGDLHEISCALGWDQCHKMKSYIASLYSGCGDQHRLRRSHDVTWCPWGEQ